jgi:hypothetical protein
MRNHMLPLNEMKQALAVVSFHRDSQIKLVCASIILPIGITCYLLQRLEEIHDCVPFCPILGPLQRWRGYGPSAVLLGKNRPQFSPTVGGICIEESPNIRVVT